MREFVNYSLKVIHRSHPVRFVNKFFRAFFPFLTFHNDAELRVITTNHKGSIKSQVNHLSATISRAYRWDKSF